MKIVLGGLVLAAIAAASVASAQDAPYCREYQQRVTIGGVVHQSYGTACMQPDGSWKRSDADVVSDDVSNDMQMAQTTYVQQPQVQTTYVQPVQRVVYEEPVYYPSPVVYPSVGLSFGFNDWHGGGGGWNHGGGGWHGGGGGWHH